jgi:hypothetical protein
MAIHLSKLTEQDIENQNEYETLLIIGECALRNTTDFYIRLIIKEFKTNSQTEKCFEI